MAQNILVIQTAFIGDAILTLPLIQELSSKYNNKIDVVCTPVSKEIFSSSPFVGECFVLDKKGAHKSLLATIKFAKALRKKKYHHIYSPHRSFRSSVIVFLLRKENSTGFDNSSFRFVYNNKIKYEKDYHEVYRNLSLLGDYDNGKWKILPLVNVTDKEKAEVRQFLKNTDVNKLKVTIAPGTVWETKRYPEKYYVEIIKFLLDNNYEVILIGGKNDVELCKSIEMQFNGKIFNSTGKFSVPQTIYLLKNSKLLISNDSAPTHMAMAADIPTLTIFCSTVPQFGFIPYNNKSSFVSYDNLECKPCGIHGQKKCPLKTFECGIKLVPDLVIDKIKQLLQI